MSQTEQLRKNLTQPGIVAALGAALLFGSSTPLAKLLLADVSPWLLAALLYLGSGIGLTLYSLPGKVPAGHLPRAEWPWLAGAIFTGGVLGPGLQMLGLTRMPASGASLLLNAESVFTALLAWFVFRENFDRRIALGMGAILAGLLILSWPGEAKFSGVVPELCVLGACLCWAIDNNLTRKVSLSDATWIASWKGLVAGGVNLALVLALGAKWPSLPHIAGALVVGFFAYGASLALFVTGLRHLGTARTGAYFSVAPFFGTVLSIAFLHEPITLKLLAAGALMAVGLWLHLTEKHSHTHVHEAMDHEHEHIHDEHHQHAHPYPVAPSTVHTHMHHHEPMTHTHEHYPDAHHRHPHE
ncbi:MAG TPA: EamA family transporter [Edaphobacter sp.]|jgi:drug/metabolite transporter (DMT)-like permease|nr:EamA family transporter [Edaphobacter sp.]